MAQAPVVEEVGDADSATPKKSKKKLIIIIAAVLLLIGGAGAGWYFMSHKANHGAKVEAKKEEAPKEPIFVKLETFTVNLNPDDGEKYLQVDITLNASDKPEADLLTVHMPQVRNRVLMLLTSKTATEISSMEGKQALSDELTKEINKPYAKGEKPLNLGGVFFTSFVIQ